MNTQKRSKEQRILVVMRKVLASIVKDTTPEPGMRHPLKDHTIEDIRECFKLISAREQELASESGLEIKERPNYPDQPQSAKVVSFISSSKPKSSETPD